MKLILNEKSSLDSVLKKVAQAAVKLGFDQAESDAAKAAVVSCNLHCSPSLEYTVIDALECDSGESLEKFSTKKRNQPSAPPWA